MLKSSVDVNALVAAAELIDAPEKWCKYVFHDGHGARCINGALLTATRNFEGAPQARRLSAHIAETAARLFPHNRYRQESWVEEGADVMWFNDHAETTHAHVMHVMREAIATSP